MTMEASLASARAMDNRLTAHRTTHGFRIHVQAWWHIRPSSISGATPVRCATSRMASGCPTKRVQSPKPDFLRPSPESDGLLKSKGQVIVEELRVQRTNVMAIDGDGTFFYVVESSNQFCDGTFSAPLGPTKAMTSPGLTRSDVTQRGSFTVGNERDVLQFDFTRRSLGLPNR